MATAAQLYLGTSSWTADGWVGSFYPEGTKQADFLPYYAQHFNTVEIDSTFYRVPTAQTVANWRERTPDGFLFAAKVPQIITHEKTLVDAEDDLKTFLSVMDGLGDKLGPLLFQFPYFNKQKFRGVGFFLERLDPWLAALPKGHEWAVEVRNRTWLTEKLYSTLRRHQVALALVDHPWMPRPNEIFNSGDPITSNFVYIRWLGDRKGIEEQTKVWNRTIVDRSGELAEWGALIPRLRERVLKIVGFSNNHYGGFAPDTIRQFLQILKLNQPARPRKKERPEPGQNLTFSF